LVLKAQQEGIAKAIQGNPFYGPHKAAQAIIAQGLIDLGIIKETSEASIYFNHGTSHYLGMEVHDPGNYGPLQPGMVITVEPGIYIPENSKCDRKWWNIGVRIEDDILITDNQPFVMSGKLPSSVVEIEKLMEKESLFNEIK
jgi:Xaa-Pro aminopeptidase